MSKAADLARTASASETALGNRNLIINGGFDVWQRGTARRYVHNTYTADRWAEGQHQGGGYEKVTVTDTTVPLESAMRVSSSSTTEAASGTRMALATMLENVDSERYAGKTVTLSFWVRFSASSLAGATGGWDSQLSEYDSVDPTLQSTGATRTNTVNIPNGSYPTTWTKYKQTVTCGAGMKNLGARFLSNSQVNTTNNSDFWYDITGVQLEAGPVATPFEHRSYGQELALCQRYFQQLFSFQAYASNTTTIQGSAACIISMRATPTLSAGGALTVTDGAANYAQSSLNFGGTTGTSNGLAFNAANFSGLTQFRPCMNNSESSSVGSLTFSAEL